MIAVASVIFRKLQQPSNKALQHFAAGLCLFTHLSTQRAFLSQGSERVRNRAADCLQRLNHARRQVVDSPDTILAGDDIAALGIEEPDDLIIPGRLVKTFEQSAILPAPVVVDEHRKKFILDHLDKSWV